MSQFVTKDSGERQTFSTGMVRDSAQKDLRPDLLPVEMLRRLRREPELDIVGWTPEELADRAFDTFLDWFSGDDFSAVQLLRFVEGYERSLKRPPMIARWAELMGRGAAKYGERNWEKACTPEELERFRQSAFRHLVQWHLGLNSEEDHAAAIFFNVGGAEFVKEKLAAAALATKPEWEADPFKSGAV
jgi:hypothetical protein